MTQTTMITTHALSNADAAAMAAMRSQVLPFKGMLRGTAAREQFDGIASHVRPADGVEYTKGSVGAVAGLWANVAGASTGSAILYAHGGWFNWGTSWAYRNMVGHLAVATGVNVFAPDYRLAPEHPFPAAPDDIKSAYEGLVAQGYKKIFVIGDSAGGNLALGLLTRGTVRVPDAVVALSPVTDLTLSGESFGSKAEVDPYFVKDQAAELVSEYLRDGSATNPLASPLFADMGGFPRIRIHVGEDEVLLDDSVRFAQRAQAAGADVKVDIWQGVPHGFQFGVGGLDSANSAMKAIGEFIKSL